MKIVFAYLQILQIVSSYVSSISAVTTPLDVAKTRIMLADAGSEIATKQSISYTLGRVWQEFGIKGLFAGVVPRTLWISIGGAVFFGVYEKSRIVANSLLHKQK